MDAQHAIRQLRSGEKPTWPQHAASHDFAQSLDNSTTTFRDQFRIPTRAQLKRTSIVDDEKTKATAQKSEDSSIYFCGNSLGLQPKAVSEYLNAYLQTWGSIAVNGHFTQIEDSPLVPYQDMAADCARKSADIVGASPEEIVVMNTLTVNLHLMMAAFYRPTEKKHKIMLEWRPFPSDYYAIESQIEWHNLKPEDSMLKVQPDDNYLITTAHVTSLIDKHADELALILLPGVQYYSGQLLDIPTISKHAHSRGVTIGWDLAHAAGNVELKLHEWDVDFACWCTYKYMNSGPGSIAGVFIHEKHGDSARNRALKGWYGHEKSSRFLMDNKFVPTPGAQGFQLSNPSVIDLTAHTASLSVFNQTSMTALRSKSLLLTAYAEHLLNQIAERTFDGSYPFEIITPSNPLRRGAQLSVLLREELMEEVSKSLEAAGIICDKRKPGCIRVAPAPLYNTFSDIQRFMETFEQALRSQVAPSAQASEGIEARL
ncbi:hypothetical protein DOTSEDRAFT_72683 [Dothistroma septosporum NZE10]|uniref:Kynureninase n=1 Tax=Dothistroma septosporum (strain NZE10 / CBS 128990) TaxID=675120 RepID=M2YN19_DOTSN|nr:hypothetical protein DOTSEDRAFT_72683 [Dothistroma septosporum NZE10]